MEHLLIGLTVGIIMGLTGAGGALISLPLFIYLLNTSLKEATILSLITVIMGTLVNLFGQKHKANAKIVIIFVLFGMIANFATLPLKTLLPDLVIALSLLAIGVFSIKNIWRVPKAAAKISAPPSTTQMAGLGLLLGLITTLTGLGGGVILVPILKSRFHQSYEQALPTSLLTILLISTISLLFQMQLALNLITIMELALISAGALSAFFSLQWMLRRIRPAKVEIVRKVVFTLVTVYSVSSVLLKSI